MWSGTVTQSAPPWSSCTTIQMKFVAGIDEPVLGDTYSSFVPLGIESVTIGPKRSRALDVKVPAVA